MQFPASASARAGKRSFVAVWPQTDVLQYTSQPHGELGRTSQPAPLLGQGQATAALYELTQNLASQLTLSWDAPEQYRLDDVTTMVSPWRRGQFELSNIPAAALLETDLFAALGRHPGTMLASLTRKTNDLTIKGCIYALTND